jgi:hypothetical protein
MAMKTEKGSVSYYKTSKEAKADAQYHRKLGSPSVIRLTKYKDANGQRYRYAVYHY